MTQDPTPHEALASIQAAREGLAQPTAYPIGYDLLYGAVCALLVAGQGMPRPWSFIALPIVMAGLILMIVGWRKKFGWWVSGYSPKRARWIAFALAAVLIGLMGLSIWGKAAGIVWMPLATGAAGFVAAIVGGRIWMAIWRRELAEADG